MAATELTAAPPARRLPTDQLATITGVAITITTLTLLSVIAAALDPTLAPAGTPHPTLHGTPGEALSILTHNLRSLAAPVILAFARWDRGRVTRHLGDLIVAAIVLANTLTVGLALGRFGTSLMPYLPHLPFEWSALTLAASAWVSQRRGPHQPAVIARYGAGAIALTIAAALLETFAVPHAH